MGRIFEMQQAIGDFKSVNIDEQLRHLLYTVKALRRGDFSARLPIGQEGIIAEIGEVINDIIEHNENMANNLIEATQEVVKANLAKTHFLANISHEIRTPMSAILGFTELLQNPNQTVEERMQCISTIHRNGKQLLALIDEILDISKLEAGHLHIENLECDVVSLINETKSLLYFQTERKGLDFKFVFESKVPTVMMTDPVHIRQIIMNVVGNAIKFTEKGSVKVFICWTDSTFEYGKGQLKIKVTDTGVGIDDAHLERLFQPFAQVDSSMTRKFGGTGLGLTLSRQLARALGGDVQLLHSKLGVGSTFEITIEAQIKESVSRVGSFQFTENSEIARAAFHNEKEILKDVNILVVDDAPDNQTVIGLFLGLAGAQVEFADNGAEGIEKALSGNYNVVLMDIQMPYVDGYEATRRLRELGYDKPIIALTAHALKEERERCLRVGFTDHFSKPIDRLKLISLVDQKVQINQ